MADQPVKQTSEEIDLGQVFQIIGKAFQNLIDGFGRLLQGLLQLVLTLLLFVRKHFILMLVTGLIGVAAGIYLDSIKEVKYISKMVVEPNFNSVQQLYNNISFYNDLAEAGDSIALSEALNLTSAEAASISKIFVDSYTDNNQKVKLFDQFVRELDTSTVKAIDFDSYLKNFNAMDAKFHQISLVSTDSKVAKKTQEAIVESISSNAYFRLQKSINDENILLQDSIIKQQMVEIDSLQKLYKTVLVKEADKPMQGTNISLAENGEAQNKELALVKERNMLKDEMVFLNLEKANKSTIVNIISDFPTRGVELKGLMNSYKFLMPVALLLFVLLLLALRELNRFLKQLSQERMAIGQSIEQSGNDQ